MPKLATYVMMYAEYGQNSVRQRFPLGGINRKDCYDKNPDIHAEIVKLLKYRKAEQVSDVAHSDHVLAASSRR